MCGDILGTDSAYGAVGGEGELAFADVAMPSWSARSVRPFPSQQKRTPASLSRFKFSPRKTTESRSVKAEELDEMTVEAEIEVTATERLANCLLRL